MDRPPSPASPSVLPAGRPPGATELARRVIALRRARGWSRRRLAAALWVSWRTVEHWELGHYEPSGPALLLMTQLEAGPQASSGDEKS